MTAVQWFEADEMGLCCGSYTVAAERDFISLLDNNKVLDTNYGDIFVVSLDTETDGLPHRKLMCSYAVYEIGVDSDMKNLAERITEDEEEGDIYDAFTLDNHIVLTSAAYDYRTTVERN